MVPLSSGRSVLLHLVPSHRSLKPVASDFHGPRRMNRWALRRVDVSHTSVIRDRLPWRTKTRLSSWQMNVIHDSSLSLTTRYHESRLGANFSSSPTRPCISGPFCPIACVHAPFMYRQPCSPTFQLTHRSFCYAELLFRASMDRRGLNTHYFHPGHDRR